MARTVSLTVDLNKLALITKKMVRDEFLGMDEGEGLYQAEWALNELRGAFSTTELGPAFEHLFQVVATISQSANDELEGHENE